MKKHLILFVLILFGMVSAYSQGFGYRYSTGRENVQMQTPIAAAGADRPDAIWAVSGNLQPFGTCQPAADAANNTPSYAGRRFAPPTTGGKDPTNPSLLPIGDIDWVCGLLLVAYIAGMLIRRQHKAKKHNQPLCD